MIAGYSGRTKMIHFSSISSLRQIQQDCDSATCPLILRPTYYIVSVSKLEARKTSLELCIIELYAGLDSNSGRKLRAMQVPMHISQKGCILFITDATRRALIKSTQDMTATRRYLQRLDPSLRRDSKLLPLYPSPVFMAAAY